MTLPLIAGQSATPAPPAGAPAWYEPPTPARPRWLFTAGPWNARPQTPLSTATARSVTWRRTGSSEASVTMPGHSAETAAIDEMISDLWVLRNGQALFRGRFGARNDQADADDYTVQFGVGDYRAVLGRRQLYEGDVLSYLSTDPAAIAWGLLSSTQSKPGGNLGITRGAGQTTGVIRDRSDYVPGQWIGEALDQLSQVIDGFDYDLTPNILTGGLTFDIYYPSRGTEKGRVLDYGGRVTGFSRQVDPGAFGNAARGTGADGLAAVRMEAAGLATAAEGRWDLQYADTSITLPTTLSAKTAQALATGQILAPSWTVTLAAGAWGGPDDIWLGDQVTLVVKLGSLDVVESLRVEEIGLTLDEDDNETVTATLGSPDPRLRRYARSLERRIANLERR